MKLVLSLVALLLVSSCAHMKSGRYIEWKKGYTLSNISKKFNVPRWAIEDANKKSSFRPGSWVFIPKKIGFLNRSYRSPSSVEYIAGSREFAWPVPASKRVTSTFGRRWGKHHDGIDIGARRGSHIVSIDDGVVVYSGKELGGYGNITVIAHKMGIFSIYAHANKNYTRKGQKVHKGQVIATVGSTGRSTGPHLHFEIRQNSKAVNPKSFVSVQ